MWILYLFPATINLFIVLQIISKMLGSRLFYHLIINLSDNLSNSTSSNKQIIEFQNKELWDINQLISAQNDLRFSTGSSFVLSFHIQK